MSYEVEIVERKDSIVQLKTSKLSIKNLFSDLLNETKGFKYQIIVKVLLEKYKPNREIELSLSMLVFLLIDPYQDVQEKD